MRQGEDIWITVFLASIKSDANFAEKLEERWLQSAIQFCRNTYIYICVKLN